MKDFFDVLSVLVPLLLFFVQGILYDKIVNLFDDKDLHRDSFDSKNSIGFMPFPLFVGEDLSVRQKKYNRLRNRFTILFWISIVLLIIKIYQLDKK